MVCLSFLNPLLAAATTARPATGHGQLAMRRQALALCPDIRPGALAFLHLVPRLRRDDDAATQLESRSAGRNV